MPLGITWDITPSEMLKTLVAEYAAAIDSALWELAEVWSPIIEEYMKINAPWIDRTSNARQGLNVRPRREGHVIHIDLAHTMEYGIYLELANAGSYAIINPTLDIYAPMVWDSVKKLLK